MNSLMNSFVVACALVFAIPAAQAAESKSKTQMESQGEKASMGGSHMAMASASSYKVIQFKKGDTALDAKGKQNLKTLIDTAKAKGEIDTVHVAVWSDQPFPKGQTELKAEDKKIASQRSDAIQNYIEDTLKVSSVDTHSMAEKTGWLAKAFNTDEAELKSMFAQRGAPVTDQEFQVVKKNGGPSKAIVWLEMKNKDSKSSSSMSK